MNEFIAKSTAEATHANAPVHIVGSLAAHDQAVVTPVDSVVMPADGHIVIAGVGIGNERIVPSGHQPQPAKPTNVRPMPIGM